MAFVKLFPQEGQDPLPVDAVIERLRNEFDFLDEDADAGQEHVASMIAATLPLAQTIPPMKERLVWLQSIQHAAVMVSFGDSAELVATCCVLPNSDLMFGSPDEVNGTARALVERAGDVLNYVVSDG